MSIRETVNAFARIKNMRLVVQRVKEARVFVNSDIVGEIDCGLFVLVGVGKDDNKEKAKELAEKLSKLRVMADKDKKMNLSVKEVGGRMLVVSQFTLFADTSKGNRPSFVKAANPKKAEDLYKFFVAQLKKNGVEVETGNFGDYMQIDAKLDGPVTIILEN